MEKKEGYKKTEIGWIPEDWEAKPLGSIGQFLKGKGIAKKDLIAEGIPCIRYGEIYTVHHWILKKFYSFVSSKTASQSTKILKNDILFAGSGETVEEIGKAVSYLGDDEAYAGGDTIILRPDNTNSAFLSACLDIETSHKQKRKLGQGNSVVHIYAAGLKKLLVPLPPLPEQTKIADILTTVDDKISSIDSQIQQTEQLKKGLMEKLLTEGIGHTEFKETEIGRIPKGWDFGELNTISDLQVGYAFKSSWFSNAGISLLRGENVGYGAPDWSNNKCLSNEQSKEYSGYFLKENDIVIGMDRTFTKSGVKISKITDNDLPSLLVQRVGRFLPSKCDNDFLWQLVRSEYYLLSLQNQQKGMDIPHLSKSEIMSILVAIPPLQEQKKIAAILSTVDDKLDILNQKKSHYQTLKKGLSQQLLTGQMRVKV